MKILVTGFDPFDREKINPAYDAVKLLPESICGAEIIKLEIPTVFARCAEAVEQAVERHNPDIVLCVGQAGGRSCISVEKVAINFAEARIPDNDGNQPLDKAIVPDGPAAYFSTLPVRAMAQAITDAGLPGQVSYTAGAFVCNDLLYTVLHHFAGTAVRAAFVHVPFLPQQAAEGVPSMTLEEIEKALQIAILAM